MVVFAGRPKKWPLKRDDRITEVVVRRGSTVLIFNKGIIVTLLVVSYFQGSYAVIFAKLPSEFALSPSIVFVGSPC